ncbi:MAG TPA: hypothetical protein VHC90_20820 [Bryobacteraceae bacterium]|nr:hypothetical protein [Bryobacteraceae bacterium]
MTRALQIGLVLGAAVLSLQAQEYESDSGFGLRGTLSTMAAGSTEFQQPPRSDSGSLVDGGVRLMLYPTWKLSDHWMFYGAYQVVSHPYYYSQFETQGHGLRGNVVQGFLSYSQIWKDASVQVKAGELSSAFGSFGLRYDDRDNPLIDVPVQYGYYGALATLTALAGAEIDTTWKKLDGRVQFTNSSPANPRSIFASEQYGNWAGGGGVTIRQGLRLGVSGYRGPYLDRTYPFYRASDGRPRNIPGSGAGADAEWGKGHWNVRGEIQRFVMTYGTAPTFHEHTGYTEIERTLGPRWYVATRLSYLSADHVGRAQVVEAAAGYRPGARQLIKISYETTHSETNPGPNRTLAIQFVTAIHPLAFAGR